MSILWLKALHIFFMVAWMAGIFYLPRLFVYHAQTDIQAVRDQFKVMERKLWFFITPFALLTLIFGISLIYQYGTSWLVTSQIAISRIVVCLSLLSLPSGKSIRSRRKYPFITFLSLFK